MSNEHVLISYPRSGNHLLRFIVEYITSFPTKGCTSNDKPVCNNKYPTPTLMDHVCKNESYILSKLHVFPQFNHRHNSPLSAILIVRDYRECIIKYTQYSTSQEILQREIKKYFDIIYDWNNFNGPKLLVRYADLMNNPNKTIYAIISFIMNHNKLLTRDPLFYQYITSRLNKFISSQQILYNECAQAKNRKWGGYNSAKKLKYHILQQSFLVRIEFENLCQTFIQSQTLDYQNNIFTIAYQYSPGYVDIVMSPTGGLCNRIRSILMQVIYNKYILSKKYSHRIRLFVIWRSDDACVQLFEDLFQSLGVSENDIYIANEYSKTTESVKHVHIDLRVNEPLDSNSFRKEIMESYSKIEPTMKIKNRITTLISDRPYIAIHVRRTDHVSLAKSKNKFTSNEEFFDFIDKQKKSLRIYLATDNKNTQTIFKKRYRKRLFWNVDIINTQNLRQTTEENAVIDMYVCSHGQSFKGSGFSSFSDTITYFREIINA
tara:strand:- start:461 stop:1927 length:1467 start_codon:yes stop_codon:yes gene_type:complete